MIDIVAVSAENIFIWPFCAAKTVKIIIVLKMWTNTAAKNLKQHLSC